MECKIDFHGKNLRPYPFVYKPHFYNDIEGEILTKNKNIFVCALGALNYLIGDNGFNIAFSNFRLECF